VMSRRRYTTADLIAVSRQEDRQGCEVIRACPNTDPPSVFGVLRSAPAHRPGRGRRSRAGNWLNTFYTAISRNRPATGLGGGGEGGGGWGGGGGGGEGGGFYDADRSSPVHSLERTLMPADHPTAATSPPVSASHRTPVSDLSAREITGERPYDAVF